MKPLTKKQAWRRIARAYEGFIAGKVLPYQFGVTGDFELGAVGLCGALSSLLHTRHITSEQRDEMKARIQDALREKGRSSWFLADYDVAGAGLRAMLATIYAEEATG